MPFWSNDFCSISSWLPSTQEPITAYFDTRICTGSWPKMSLCTRCLQSPTSWLILWKLHYHAKAPITSDAALRKMQTTRSFFKWVPRPFLLVRCPLLNCQDIRFHIHGVYKFTLKIRIKRRKGSIRQNITEEFHEALLPSIFPCGQWLIEKLKWY